MTDLDDHHESVGDAFRTLQQDGQLNTAFITGGLAYLAYYSGAPHSEAAGVLLAGLSTACVAFIVHQSVKRWREERREAKKLINEEYNNE